MHVREHKHTGNKDTATNRVYLHGLQALSMLQRFVSVLDELALLGAVDLDRDATQESR